MTVTIRSATDEDIDDIYALSCAVHRTPLYQDLIPESEQAAFIERYTPNEERRLEYQERLGRHLTDPNWFHWVAEDDGEIRGFTTARHTEEGLKLKGLFVDPESQGMGIGRSLLEVSSSVARPDEPIILDVIAANGRAIEIYRRAGFHETEFTPEPFYGAPMIRMQKH
jgi:ribosomal protein S18 acetylase RimI-like enzyme